MFLIDVFRGVVVLSARGNLVLSTELLMQLGRCKKAFEADVSSVTPLSAQVSSTTMFTSKTKLGVFFFLLSCFSFKTAFLSSH